MCKDYCLVVVVSTTLPACSAQLHAGLPCVLRQPTRDVHISLLARSARQLLARQQASDRRVVNAAAGCSPYNFTTGLEYLAQDTSLALPYTLLAFLPTLPQSCVFVCLTAACAT